MQTARTEPSVCGIFNFCNNTDIIKHQSRLWDIYWKHLVLVQSTYTKSFHAFRFPCPETKINSNKKCFSEKYIGQPRDYIEELKFDNLTP